MTDDDVTDHYAGDGSEDSERLIGVLSLAGILFTAGGLLMSRLRLFSSLLSVAILASILTASVHTWLILDREARLAVPEAFICDACSEEVRPDGSLVLLVPLSALGCICSLVLLSVSGRAHDA